LSNPGGFDYELWLFEQGVGATGNVRSGRARHIQRLDVGVDYPVQQLRQWLRERIRNRLGDSRAAGVIAALCVGDQAGISRDDWDLFRTTGCRQKSRKLALPMTATANSIGSDITVENWPKRVRLGFDNKVENSVDLWA
jgi:hypothetical protein